MTVLLSIRDLEFSYEKSGQASRVISGANLDVRVGESVAIMGSSGSGKSTLLGIAGGILTPTSGTYRFGDEYLHLRNQRLMAEFRRKQVGFVFQNFCLLPHLNLIENVLLPIRISGGRPDSYRTRAAELLHEVGLDGLANRFPNEVSGGQAQRAAIARALIRDPALVLADEPTGNLDSGTAAAIVDALKNGLGADRSLILVTHSADVASMLERTIEMKDGRLDGTLN